MMEPTGVAYLVRRLSMAILMLTHIQVAAFLIGVFGLGVTMEFFGIAGSGRARFDRLARGLARTSVLLYSTGAVIAIIFILIISLFWPIFWYTAMRVAFWPMVLEAVTFVLTILFLFPWYLTWDRLSGFKAVHIALGVALVVVAQVQQSMVDVLAGYMLTPAPQEDLLRVFFNPSAVPLDMHRIAGDVSFAGFVIAGYFGVKMLRARDPDQRAYFDWAGNMGLIAGIGFMFLQPAIGLEYVQEIRANTPGAFTAMMRGPLSWVFLVQVTFLSILFFFSLLYMFLQMKKSRSRGTGLTRALLILVGLSSLLMMQPYVIGPSQAYPWINWVNPIGSMQPWKYIALAGLSIGSIAGVLAYLSAHRRGLNWGNLSQGGRGAQYTLVVLAAVASLMMFVMGYIREGGRSPYLIYYQQRIDQPEQFPPIQLTPTPTSSSSGGDGT